jgi:hypothetical protein
VTSRRRPNFSGETLTRVHLASAGPLKRGSYVASGSIPALASPALAIRPGTLAMWRK